MYPDLSYILHALIGTQPDNGFSVVKTFGLFLVFAFLSSAFFLFLEFRRKEAEGLLNPVPTRITVGEPASPLDLIISAVVGFLLGFKVLYIVQNFSEFQADTADVLLSSKGSWIGGILGLAISAGMKYWEKNKEKLPTPEKKVINIFPHERIGDITIVAAVSGIIGAKVFAVIEDLDRLMADPIGMLLSGSGMAIYGGLIGGMLITYLYLRSIKINPIHALDASAPALFVGYGVGRMGCHFSGDGDWGDPNPNPVPDWWFFPDTWWSFNYPHNVINEGIPLENCEMLYCKVLPQGVWPTPIFEIFAAFILAAILWSVRKRIKIPGVMFCLYLILNGIQRFSIEQIRINDEYEILGMQLTQAEMIAIGFSLVGLIGVFLCRSWHQRKSVSG